MMLHRAPPCWARHGSGSETGSFDCALCVTAAVNSMYFTPVAKSVKRTGSSPRMAPMNSASTHVVADPGRTRKLLLHKKEIARLIGATQQKGQTCIPLAIYWKGNRVKCEIALATGKKDHDKRASIKDREWNRDKQRLMKDYNR